MKFLTSNAHKLAEMRSFIPELEMLDTDLPEVQSLDPHKIIRAKLEAARKISSDDLIVEDTSLTFDCLNGLPGPLVKFFLTSLGVQGLSELAFRYDEHGGTARTIIGYASGGSVEFFEGTVRGMIVAPRGSDGFGWDPIFLPDGYEQTYAELGEEKHSVSPRVRAIERFVESLKR